MKSLKITLLAVVVVALTVSVYSNPTTTTNEKENTYKTQKPSFDLLAKAKKKRGITTNA